jgi:hypothetical protein
MDHALFYTYTLLNDEDSIVSLSQHIVTKIFNETNANIFCFTTRRIKFRDVILRMIQARVNAIFHVTTGKEFIEITVDNAPFPALSNTLYIGMCNRTTTLPLANITHMIIDEAEEFPSQIFFQRILPIASMTNTTLLLSLSPPQDCPQNPSVSTGYMRSVVAMKKDDGSNLFSLKTL